MRRSRRGFPLRPQLLSLVVLASLPAVSAAAYSAWLAREAGRTAAVQGLAEYARSAATVVRIALEQGHDLLRAMAEVEAARLAAPESCGDLLSSALRLLPRHDHLAVLDYAGRVTCAAHRSGDPPDPARPAVKTTVVTKRPGERPGSVSASLATEELRSIAGDIRLPPTAALALQERDGALVVLYPDHPATELRFPPAQLLAARVAVGGTGIAVSGRDGAEQILGAAAIAGTSWSALVAAGSSELFGPAQTRFLQDIARLTLAWAAGVLFFALVLQLAIGRRLRRLTTALVRMTGGDFDVRFPVPRFRSEWQLANALIRFIGHRVRTREARMRSGLMRQGALLREIHNRASVNLQLIANLLNLSDASRTTFDAQSRVQALAAVHSRAAIGGDPSRVELRGLLGHLAGQLLELHNADDRVAVELDVPTAWATIASAVPLALILTEAVTNAVRHAFPHGRHGTVWIMLDQREHDMTLRIVDDGVGLGGNQIQADRTGRGIRLMEALAQQLGATLELSSHAGVEVALTFARGRLQV